MSGASGRWATRLTNSGAYGPNGASGSSTLDVTVVEPVGAVVSQRDRSVLVHHHHEADTGVQRQAIDQAGKPPVQLSCGPDVLFSPRT